MNHQFRAVVSTQMASRIYKIISASIGCIRCAYLQDNPMGAVRLGFAIHLDKPLQTDADAYRNAA